MTEPEQALADLIARHVLESEYYEGKGLGSPTMLVEDIRTWLEKYYPDVKWIGPDSDYEEEDDD